MNIGTMIKNRRQELHLTLEEVGNAVGVGKSTVQKWENGFISNMKRDKIAALAKVLNINPVSLITGEITEASPIKQEAPVIEKKENSVLCNELKDLTQEERAEVLSYIRFKKSQREQTDYATIAAKGSGSKKQPVTKEQRKQIVDALHALSNDDEF